MRAVFSPSSVPVGVPELTSGRAGRVTTDEARSGKRESAEGGSEEKEMERQSARKNSRRLVAGADMARPAASCRRYGRLAAFPAHSVAVSPFSPSSSSISSRKAALLLALSLPSLVDQLQHTQRIPIDPTDPLHVLIARPTSPARPSTLRPL
jgi:hypothetical protein